MSTRQLHSNRKAVDQLPEIFQGSTSTVTTASASISNVATPELHGTWGPISTAAAAGTDSTPTALITNASPAENPPASGAKSKHSAKIATSKAFAKTTSAAKRAKASPAAKLPSTKASATKTSVPIHLVAGFTTPVGSVGSSAAGISSLGPIARTPTVKVKNIGTSSKASRRRNCTAIPPPSTDPITPQSSPSKTISAHRFSGGPHLKPSPVIQSHSDNALEEEWDGCEAPISPATTNSDDAGSSDNDNDNDSDNDDDKINNDASAPSSPKAANEDSLSDPFEPFDLSVDHVVSRVSWYREGIWQVLCHTHETERNAAILQITATISEYNYFLIPDAYFNGSSMQKWQVRDGAAVSMAKSRASCYLEPAPAEMFPNAHKQWIASLAIGKRLQNLMEPSSPEAVGWRAIDSGLPGGGAFRLGYYFFAVGVYVTIDRVPLTHKDPFNLGKGQR